MPWRDTDVTDERLSFIAAWKAQEYGSMKELCEAFGVSRTTGYKFLKRYRQGGLDGLKDRSRAPRRHPNATPERLERQILAARAAHPTWGAPKLKAWLERNFPEDQWPAQSTIGSILKSHGLTRRRRRRHRTPAYTEPFKGTDRPNAVWCADFKGWFRTGDGVRCEPLTITDAFSRYLITCRALPRQTHDLTRPWFERAFREFGLPDAIRTDNGRPFASTAVAGLSRLSVWWIRLGIRPERIEPGKPQQNGRHERFHLTLKQDTAKPPRGSLRAQQRRFNSFTTEYNEERPHAALHNQTPAEVYHPSFRAFPKRLPEMEYPGDYLVRRVMHTGQIRFGNNRTFLSNSLIGEVVGLKEIDGRYWEIYFGRYYLARIDSHTCEVMREKSFRWKPRQRRRDRAIWDNRKKVLTMSPA